MTFYVVYVAGEYSMEVYKRFSNESDAVKCAKTLRTQQKGSIYVYKETCEKIFSA